MSICNCREKMPRVRRKKVTFWAEVPSKRRTRVEFESRGETISFLAKTTKRKKVTFYKRR